MDLGYFKNLTQLSISSFNAQITTFYSISKTYISKPDDFQETGWIETKGISQVSSSNIGTTSVLIPKLFVYMNRNYPISAVSKTTDIPIINSTDFLKIITVDTDIVLSPVDLMNQLLNLVYKAEGVKDGDKVFISKSKTLQDTDNFILNKLTINPNSVKMLFNMINSYINVNEILNVLYQNMGLRIVQDFPVGLDMAQPSFTMYTLEELFSQDNGIQSNVDSVLSLNETVDYSRNITFISYTLDNEGGISSANPFNGSIKYDDWANKHVVSFLKDTNLSHSTAIGGNYQYSIASPLMSFFTNVEVKTKDKKQETPLEVAKSKILKLKAKKDNSSANSEYKGSSLLLAYLKYISSLKNRINTVSTNVSVVGIAPAYSVVNVIPRDDFILEKYKDFNYEEIKQLEINQVDLLVLSTSVQFIPTSEGVETISNLLCTELKDDIVKITLADIEKEVNKETSDNNSSDGGSGADDSAPDIGYEKYPGGHLVIKDKDGNIVYDGPLAHKDNNPDLGVLIIKDKNGNIISKTRAGDINNDPDSNVLTIKDKNGNIVSRTNLLDELNNQSSGRNITISNKNGGTVYSGNLSNDNSNTGTLTIKDKSGKVIDIKKIGK